MALEALRQRLRRYGLTGFSLAEILVLVIGSQRPCVDEEAERRDCCNSHHGPEEWSFHLATSQRRSEQHGLRSPSDAILFLYPPSRLHNHAAGCRRAPAGAHFAGNSCGQNFTPTSLILSAAC